MPRFAVILPAAGKSVRFGDGTKKVFADLDGRAVWLRAAEAFVHRDDVAQTLIVLSPDDIDDFKSKFAPHLALLGIEIVPGGSERFESVGNALARLSTGIDLVAVHDAARPCIAADVIGRVFAAAAETGAAMAAVPVSDTVKRADADGNVEATLSRERLWLAQTPQVFSRDVLVEAHARRASLGTNITDDAQLVEACGKSVRLVLGSSANIKITTREDLALAGAILKSRPEPKAARTIHPFADEVRW